MTHSHPGSSEVLHPAVAGEAAPGLPPGKPRVAAHFEARAPPMLLTGGASRRLGSGGSPLAWFRSPQFLKWLSLVLLVLQNSVHALLIRYSRSAGPSGAGTVLYLPSTTVVLGELIKLLVSVAVVMHGLLERPGAAGPGARASELPLASPMVKARGLDTRMTRAMRAMRLLVRSSWPMAVPAGLYALQNNLVFLALQNLEAATFQVMYQSKIITTALFSVALLGKRLTISQWISLLLLFLGVVLIQLPQPACSGPGDELAAAAAQTRDNTLLGFAVVCVLSATSGFAGVYFERVLKGRTPPAAGPALVPPPDAGPSSQGAGLLPGPGSAPMMYPLAQAGGSLTAMPLHGTSGAGTAGVDDPRGSPRVGAVLTELQTAPRSRAGSPEAANYFAAPSGAGVTGGGGAGGGSASHHLYHPPSKAPAPASVAGIASSLFGRNLQLSLWGLLFSLFAMLYYDGGRLQQQGFFGGYTWLTWTLVAVASLGGLLVAAVVRYTDNIAKGFATSISIVFSSTVASVWFDFDITAIFVIGASIVIASVLLYSEPDKLVAQSRA
ncbi:hypothetical protein H696_04894 [Fonticula alba]|uniref:Uncharacterized protein n=1 Tax=Fonticula alba TaxID=691883 RepID=A0A058Z399_FONAL|nr:hypothetical protein H696_04894 [Fonticula alba]KCV68601.1 hypothetical protein H696_04894 [Fonticula alba]|eukprot:XP_009497033.1 hypothetical protein H696_04894 [Fonticula alba]